MIQIQNLCLSFGQQVVFDHISCIIQPNQRVGLVGANGTGKSTMLKAITGTQLVDDGSVTMGKHFKVAYMPQEVVLQSTKTVFEEAFATFEELYRAQATLIELEPIILDNPTEAQLEAYAHAQQVIADLNIETAKKETHAVLAGLGFSDVQQQQLVSTLSVGWKMRVVLAKLLLQKADFYLFDEPTNHLDIVAKDWFLQFLKNKSCGFLLVCHERYFLDQLCSDILELELGKATWYKGNYTAYTHQKEAARYALEKAYEQQQREIAKKVETIERFRASATKAKMAQSMMKELEKIERIVLPPSPKMVNFHFGSATRAGKVVLTAKNLGFSFGHKQIFSHLSFEIERGQRVALVAPNGTGKTTLFNVVAGIYKPQEGSITIGHNVQYALFAQDQNAVLPAQKTIFEHVVCLCPKKTEQEIRGILGAFLFSNDTIHKKLGCLSGGEKNRVSMITTLMQDANFLLLDEPTNHLDMQSKEILLQALLGFNGTIFFVSHDHDFINKLATHILELSAHGIERYEGNYTDYIYQKQAKTNPTEKSSAATPSSLQAPRPSLDGKQISDLKKQLKKLEHTIATLEKDIKKLEDGFALVHYGSKEFKQQEEKLLTARKNLEKTLQNWEESQTVIDSLT